MSSPALFIFLPGIRGEAAFWEPVATHLSALGETELLRYPWASGSGAIEQAGNLDELVDAVAARITRPTALVAQSLGGVVAMLVALRKPSLVTHLVLATTSGGVNTEALGVADWKPAFFDAYPQIPRWLGADARDLSAEIRTITIPTLLLWGDADPISPLVIGERLHTLLPNSALHVVEGGEHDLGLRYADDVAALIRAHVGGESVE